MRGKGLIEPPKLLVVEEDGDTRELFASHFSAKGYAVLTTETGKEALKTINYERDYDRGFDVVLLDLFIPAIGGMELLTEVSRHTPCPSVILLMNLPDREIAREALRLGAFDCILKPYNLPQLEASVVACLAHVEYVTQSWWKHIVPHFARTA